MREDILRILKHSDGALSIYDIQHELNIENVDQVKELSDTLRELEDEKVQ